MHETSPKISSQPRFTTIRRQLLWSYGVLVILILAMVGAFSAMFSDYYTKVDELLSMNAATATITIKLKETHQLLENTINYDDPSFIRSFHEKRNDMTAYIRDYDAQVHQAAERHGDFDTYYHFQEIQKLLLEYVLESDTLLELYGQGVRGFILFDKLISLRGLNYRIYELQLTLLGRQNNYLRRVYAEYTPVIRRRFLGLIVIIFLVLVFSVIWTLKQAAAISGPLHRLVLMNMALAEGNFEAVEPLNARNEEVRQLGEAFTIMVGKLSESIETEKQALIMESSLRQAKLETLQAQINPHFLFNALNTVRSLSQLENAEQTESIIDALSAFLRYNLENQKTQMNLEEEFTTAEHYLTIQKMRFGKRLEYSVILAPEISLVKVPSLLIQPLVENAIIHGIEPLKDGGVIHLTGYLEDGHAIIKISDNGIGMGKLMMTELDKELRSDVEVVGAHVGIRNTWNRLVLTDPDARMNFLPNENGQGTMVRILLSVGV
ncbi:MAG: hypothetical protein DRP70_11305 [Spirochaetes bacterium]|nr:MAG: hypothetical protein DRP70_11305 [Spirochaetota bacterium]